MLSLPLQQIATKASCWTLQLLGQPAIAEGNTIMLGDHRLEVEQACSGLRLFVSILALAFAYLQLVKRRWWEKGLLLISVVPIAIVANAARIVATGLLYEYASTEAAKKFSHDFAGWAMIPFAAALFGAVLWYLRMLVREHEQIALSKLVRRAEI
jgi:exosortase